VQPLVTVVERLAAYFIGLVAILTFVQAVLRYVFNAHIPDGFVLGQTLQGIAICWGIATATYADRHISVEVIWTMASSRVRRIFDALAYSLNLAFMAMFGTMISIKVLDILEAGEISTELRIPVWIGYTLASAGIVAATAMALLRWWRVMLAAR
jgi:TRAP-type C4-dicarboxylate transport system permease small subunit